MSVCSFCRNLTGFDLTPTFVGSFNAWLTVAVPPSTLRVMENEEARKEYLVFPPSKSQSHGGGGGGGGQKGRKIPLKGNGRRIDYILYSDEGLQPDWKLVSTCTMSLLYPS